MTTTIEQRSQKESIVTVQGMASDQDGFHDVLFVTADEVLAAHQYLGYVSTGGVRVESCRCGWESDPAQRAKPGEQLVQHQASLVAMAMSKVIDQCDRPLSAEQSKQPVEDSVEGNLQVESGKLAGFIGRFVESPMILGEVGYMGPLAGFMSKGESVILDFGSDHLVEVPAESISYVHPAEALSKRVGSHTAEGGVQVVAK